MTTLEKVKLSLRVSSSAFDEEIQLIIDDAKKDLQLSGVVNIDETDSRILSLIILYAKLRRGTLENTSRASSFDAYKRVYDEQKAQLTMSRAYNTEG